jgi:hypothetical protein
MTTLDRRDLILGRVFTLLSGLEILLSANNASLNLPTAIVPGHIVHNRNELPKELVPGIILLDADEIKDPKAQLRAPGGIQGQMPPQLMKMTPEIYVVLDVRKPDNANVGADLNLARLAILATLWPDQTLQGIVGSNGNILYDGCVTDLARNRQMRGQLGISMTFSYPLLPSEIVGR